LVSSATLPEEQNDRVTRNVYRRDMVNGTMRAFLRFKISPTGRVVEFRPTSTNRVESSRAYLTDFYDVHLLPAGTCPSLDAMEAWVSALVRKKKCI
jgi:hypothetical protein